MYSVVVSVVSWVDDLNDPDPLSLSILARTPSDHYHIIIMSFGFDYFCYSFSLYYYRPQLTGYLKLAVTIQPTLTPCSSSLFFENLIWGWFFLGSFIRIDSCSLGPSFLPSLFSFFDPITFYLRFRLRVDSSIRPHPTLTFLISNLHIARTGQARILRGKGKYVG